MGCLLTCGAFGGGVALGLLASSTLNALTGNQQLATAVGTGVGILSSLLLLMYGPLWFGDTDTLVANPKATSVFQQCRDAKTESKLQTAELRCGVVFAIIGGATASMANGSNILIGIATVGCAILGGLAGYDLKRRVVKLRKQHANLGRVAQDLVI